jgi:hypothetical protein
LTVASGTQPLDFGCATANPAGGVNGNPDTLKGANTVNPLNDFVAEEPPLGSGNGIAAVLDLNATCSSNPTACATPPVNFARSSRTLKSTETGLNAVAYAKDAVSWFAFKYVPEGVGPHSSAGKCAWGDAVTSQKTCRTPVSTLASLTTAQLAGIWGNTTDGIITKWSQIINATTKKPYCPGSSTQGTAPTDLSYAACNSLIHPYTAQAGSGTLSTWEGFVTTTDTTYINSLPSNYDGWHTATGYAHDHIILENEDTAILANGDAAQAMFFFGYGKYNINCKGARSLGCAPKGYTAAFGAVNGITASAANILCATAAACSGLTPATSPFPYPRYVYNMYSDGSNTAVPAATPATVNYVSEVGALCKPAPTTGTNAVIDPNTGIAWHTEIATAIAAEGFLALPLQHDEILGTLANPGVNILDAGYTSNAAANPYILNDPVTGGGAATNTGSAGTIPSGYCIVSGND